MTDTAEGGNKHLVMIVIDASRRDVFYDNFDSGNLPNFQRAFRDGCRVERAISMFPSVTIPCLATIFTGCHFKSHGILNNVWFDRGGPGITGRAYLSVLDETVASFGRKQYGFPTIILPDIPEGGLVNNDIQVPSIYDDAAGAGLTSQTAFSYVGKGATQWLRPRRRDMILYAIIDKWNWDYRKFDRKMVKVAVNGLKRGVPNIMALYFGGHDGYSHRHGPLRQHEYLIDTVDPGFGRFITALERKLGSLDGVHFALTADHGQTEAPETGHSLWTRHIEGVLQANGWKFGGGEVNEVDNSVDVVYMFGTGGSFALQVRNSQSGEWNVDPDFERDVLPKADAFIRASAPGLSGKPGYIGDYLDFVMVRKGINQGYLVYEKDAMSPEPGRLIGLEEFFRGRDAEYPDAIERIGGMEHQRSGDIICVLRYDEGWYIGGAFHAGNHGALNVRDSYIPIMFSGPGVRSGSVPFGRLIDFAPTAASLIGVEMPRADGKVLGVMR